MTFTSLPVRKPATKTQLAETFVAIPFNHLPHSAELRERTGFTGGEVAGYFNQVHLYEASSVASKGDALLLFAAGYTTRKQALDFLIFNGFEDLIVDSSVTAAAAMDRRIPATHYLSSESIRNSGSQYMLDAMELSSTASLGSFQNLVDGVLDGTISYPLIKRLGIVRLSKIYNKTIVKALTAVSSGTTPFTEDGFRQALQKVMYGPSISSDCIELGLLYGDRAVEVTGSSYALHMHNYLMENHPDASLLYRWGAVAFSADLYINLRLQRKRTSYSFADELIFYESGAIVSEVCNGTMTLERAQAIKDGLPSSISSGLL